MCLDIANIQIKPGCVTNWLCSDSKKKDVFQDIFLCNNSRKFSKWIDTLSCERATKEKTKKNEDILTKTKRYTYIINNKWKRRACYGKLSHIITIIFLWNDVVIKKENLYVPLWYF